MARIGAFRVRNRWNRGRRRGPEGAFRGPCGSRRPPLARRTTRNSEAVQKIILLAKLAKLFYICSCVAFFEGDRRSIRFYRSHSGAAPLEPVDRVAASARAKDQREKPTVDLLNHGAWVASIAAREVDAVVDRVSRAQRARPQSSATADVAAWELQSPENLPQGPEKTEFVPGNGTASQVWNPQDLV